MRLFLPRPLAPLFLLAFAAAFPAAAAGGCGRTACFAYTQEAYAKNGNACPAQKDALPNFTDSQCPGPVVSVDGQGSFDGELCCYPVTEEDITPNCGQGGAGGAFPTMSFAAGPPPPGPVAVAVAASTVVGSGGGPCVSSCAVAITNGGTPCTTGASQYASLQSCSGCTGVGSCVQECIVFCEGGAIDGACLACLQMGCETELTDCQND